MAEYISREEALNLIEHNDRVEHYMAKIYEEIVYSTTQRVCEVIAYMPAADVQPVRRGKWIITDDVEHFIAVCSECGRTEDSRDIKDMPYCHCGARMDGDTE